MAETRRAPRTLLTYVLRVIVIAYLGLLVAWPVVLVAIAASIMAVFFYVRHIRLMFFSDADAGEGATVTTPSILTIGTVAICLAATLVLGVVPGPVLDLVGSTGDFLR